MLSSIALSALLWAAAVVHHPELEHLRPASPEVRELIDRFAARSPHFATLLDRLDRTTVVVYIAIAVDLPASREGHLHFVTASQGLRFVRVELRAGLPPNQLAASLAHELMHAIEIGEHPEVQCHRTLERLYRRIGRQRGETAFETVAAAASGRQVREELVGGRAAGARVSP
jgi:hypothetical protein